MTPGQNGDAAAAPSLETGDVRASVGGDHNESDVEMTRDVQHLLSYCQYHADASTSNGDRWQRRPLWSEVNDHYGSYYYDTLQDPCSSSLTDTMTAGLLLL